MAASSDKPELWAAGAFACAGLEHHEFTRPFANAMMAGLLLLLMIRSTLKLPAAAAGYVAFLLSMVRTAWLACSSGFS